MLMPLVSKPESVAVAGALVIPAHNEAAVIARCLRAALRDAEPGELRVLLVSNASTDHTVEVARATAARLGHDIDVVELPVASKVAALRAADAALDAELPRIYLDADVVLSTGAIRRLFAALQTEAPRLALARIDVDLTRSSWLVRQFYRAWARTDYIRRQDAGSGVFALNAAGVRRVGPLPDVINDDGYVARCFGPDERVVCDVTFRSFAARSMWALVRRRARIINGNRQLERRGDGVRPRTGSPVRSGGGAGAELLAAVRQRQLPATSAAVFLLVGALARALAYWRRLTGAAGRWATDTTSRG
jgi:glycosyltransferase involved in cell wall biosynthesis